MSDENGSVFDAGNPAATTQPTQPNEEKPWYEGFQDASVKDWAAGKGWKSPEAATQSAWHLERLLGADKAGRGLVLPKDEADAEGWNNVYSKLGRPASADAYEIPVPEGDTGEFLKTAKEWFHGLGLNNKQAQGLAEKWNAHGQQMMEAEENQFLAAAERDIESLQTDWGDQFNVRAEVAKRAMREAGLTPEEGQQLERALGVAKAAKVFEFFGKHFMEHEAKGMDGGSNKFGVTPVEAKSRIENLRGDPEFTRRYISGDADARAEMERLHKIAFPG